MNLDQTTNIQKRIDRLVELNVREPGLNIIDVGQLKCSRYNTHFLIIQCRAIDVKTGKEVGQKHSVTKEIKEETYIHS